MPLNSTPVNRDVMATHSGVVYAYVVLFVVDVPCVGVTHLACQGSCVSMVRHFSHCRVHS